MTSCPTCGQPVPDGARLLVDEDPPPDSEPPREVRDRRGDHSGLVATDLRDLLRRRSE